MWLNARLQGYHGPGRFEETWTPAIRGGKACIRGMRVTVATVIRLIAAVHSFPKHYPASLCNSVHPSRRMFLIDMNLSPLWVGFFAPERMRRSSLVQHRQLREFAKNLGVSVPTFYRWIPASSQP